MSAFRRDGADLLLAVRLTPRARRQGLRGLWTDEHGAQWLQASVAAPPDKGRANAGLIDLLANVLGTPASTISLETGATNRLKRLRIRDAAPGTEEAILTLAAEDET